MTFGGRYKSSTIVLGSTGKCEVKLWCKIKLKNFSCDTPPYCLNSDLVTSNLAVYFYCWQLTDGWLTVYFLINSSVSYSICRISISVGKLSLHTGSTWSLFWTKHLDQASQKIPLHIYSTWSKTYFFVQNI